MKIKSKQDIFFDCIIYSLLFLCCLITIVPFLQAVTISLSPASEVNKYGLHLIPTSFNLEGYQKVIQHDQIWIAYKNTIIRTVLGTFLAVALTVLAAYPLAKKDLPHRTFWTGFIVFTMYFSGGLIPRYLLVNNLGLLNSMSALVLPSMISAFTLIVTRNFFMTIPESLEESARIDGANDLYILYKIIIPISKPIIATITLWYGVWHWNQWFDCMIYIMDKEKFVLQYVLRQIVLEGQMSDSEMAITDVMVVNTETMKMATLVVATLPIICVYPFLQKYFVKGVMMGSLKG
ncbi:carbohydrate ABC transporter permease [Vallitalea okinawensis]|uniref:carbohydrate ABC transporter permease n=1 Tax=Vallitalea okinawensis TaxID=2078660 RepID=UPI000CFC6AB0|nr:carbohydrate ABC transporter permease [Vallitalea okinawensis]